MASYGLGVGIGNALVQLPQGIYQGEEIARRRQREDEQSQMARAEFENRQTMFGRTKQEWTHQDIERKVSGDLQAGIITPEQAYTQLAQAGAGDAALRLRGVMTQLQSGEQQLDQGKQMFEANLESHRLNMENAYGAKLDRDMVRSWATGDYGSIQKALQAKADTDPEHYGKTVQSVQPVLDQRGRTIPDRNGMTQVKIDYVDNDGKPQSHVMNVGQFGAFMGAPGLQTLAAQEQQAHMWHTQMGMAASDKRDMKAKELYAATLAEKQAQAKPYQDEFDKNMHSLDVASKAYYDRLGMVGDRGDQDPGVMKLKANMDSIEKKIQLARSQRDAALHGYKWDEIKDPATGEVAGIDLKRSIIPFGTKNPTYKLDWRPKDNAIYANQGNVTRLLSMTMPRQDGEGDDAYKNRLDSVAKEHGMGAGWYALMAPKNGSSAPVLVPVGYTSTSQTEPQKKLLAAGWQPVNPPGMDFGTGMSPDVQQDLMMQEQFTATQRGVSARSSGSAGRVSVGGRGMGVVMVPPMRGR